jgi:hypothetical protein
LGERTTANGLERANRRRHSRIGERRTGFGHVSGEAPRTVGRTATAWASNGCEERARERKEARGRRRREELGVQFIEKREGEEGAPGCFMAMNGVHQWGDKGEGRNGRVKAP